MILLFSLPRALFSTLNHNYLTVFSLILVLVMIIYLVWYIFICFIFCLFNIYLFFELFLLIIVTSYCILYFLYLYILVHMTLNYFIYCLTYYIGLLLYFFKSLKKISLYHKKRFVLITWNKYADIGLSYVLFWFHPPQNDSTLVISPLYKYIWHYYVL